MKFALIAAAVTSALLAFAYWLTTRAPEDPDTPAGRTPEELDAERYDTYDPMPPGPDGTTNNGVNSPKN